MECALLNLCAFCLCDAVNAIIQTWARIGFRGFRESWRRSATKCFSAVPGSVDAASKVCGYRCLLMPLKIESGFSRDLIPAASASGINP